MLFSALHKTLSQTNDITNHALHVFDATIVTQCLKILLASIVLGLVSYGTLYLVNPILNTHTVFGIFAQAGIATTAGVLVYILLTRSLGLKESEAIFKGMQKIWHLFKHKKARNQN